MANSNGITIGQVLEALNDKADLDLENTGLSGLENNNGTLTWDGKSVATVYSIQNISSTSGTVSLSANNVYTITLSGNVTFSLPQATAGVLNQIEIQLYMPSVYTIDLGTTTYFGGEAPDISEAGYYTIIYEYDNIHSVWVVGALKKASS
jgi:hypothetical protein